MTKYCPKCGTELDDDVDFCVKCGNKFPKDSKLTFNFNKKNILIIVLLVILIAICSFAIYNYFSPNIQTYDVGVATFNTTNTTNFTLKNSSQGMKEYWDDSGKYTLYIFKYNEMDYSNIAMWKGNVEYEKKRPAQTVDGIVVYTTSATVGKFVGESRYSAVIENHDLNIDVYISTPDINETAYVVKSFKFK